MGSFQAILSDTVTEVNARAVAKARGIDLIESSSTRPRSYRSLLSLKLHHQRWRALRGRHGRAGPRARDWSCSNGVPLEAPLAGTMLLFENNDQPGVIGEVGTILGKHGINIANFALGRTEGGRRWAPCNVDEPAERHPGEERAEGDSRD